MRRILACTGAAALALVYACATDKTQGFPDSDGGADAATDGIIFAGDGSVPETAACATGVYEAKQAPAAMLVVLQNSGSMAMNSKFAFAAQAVVQALDANVFDTMSLGLLAEPSQAVLGPKCLTDLIPGIQVACGVPPFPQVDLAPATTYKSSDPTGVRHAIKGWLAAAAPVLGDAGDGNPLYDAIKIGIGTLKGWPQMGKRILFVVTDGAISCTSLAMPSRPFFQDGNNCGDWEDPNNIMTLVSNANKDPMTPIDTFIVGVPGSDTYDPTAMNYPPYHMRAALSSIAAAGSPANVPAGCNSTMPFKQTDPDPAKSCHFDMTGSGYSAAQVADAISLVRGKVLGCIFDLPTPDGGSVDLGHVNVDYSVGGGAATSIYKRKDMTNMCTTDGCWDYTSDNKVELIGKACDDIKSSPDAKVEISVGCETIVK